MFPNKIDFSRLKLTPDFLWKIARWACCLLVIAAFIFFLVSEEFTFLHLIIFLVLIFSFYKAYKGEDEFLVFVGMFLVFQAFFGAITRISLLNGISSILLAIFILYFLTLLNKDHIQTGELRPKDFWAFSWLLILLVLELFFTLSFFPVNNANKAILLTIFFWFYAEAMRARIETRFSRQFMIYLTVVFVIIFSLLVFSIPFEQRF